MSNGQTIFLNGRRYDALTGKQLKQKDNLDLINSPKANTTRDIRRPHLNHSVDGIIENVQLKKHTSHNKKPHHSVAPHINRITEHSKTLMREAVKHPAVKKVKTQQDVVKHHINNAVGKSVTIAAPTKAAIVTHARNIRRSDFVTKFNEYTPTQSQNIPEPTIIQTTANSPVHIKNINQLEAIDNNPSIDNIFSEAALKLSDSYQPINTKNVNFIYIIADFLKLSVKTFVILSATIFIILVTIISGYLFRGNIQMFFADNRTGIHGILPTYIADGYSLQSINYIKRSPTGIINIQYSGSSQTDNYKIVEQGTSLNSDSLVTGIVIPTVGNNYKTYQVGGRTVYMYEHTASWIDSGIFYTLTNSANLTPKQINQIVSTT